MSDDEFTFQTTKVVYKLPVYPGWRMWLWRIFRVKRPLWNVYEFDDVKFTETDLSFDFVANGGGRLIHKNVSAKVAEV